MGYKKSKLQNYLKLGILLFGISILLWNCEKENEVEVRFETPLYVTAETVSFKEAKDLFNKKNDLRRLSKSKNKLQISPNWNSIAHQPIAYTDALLTKVNTLINIPGNYSAQSLFIKIDGVLKDVLLIVHKDKQTLEGNVIEGHALFSTFDGQFLDGYKIENGIFTKRLVVVQK